jgi:hypothetical protein
MKRKGSKISRTDDSNAVGNIPPRLFLPSEHCPLLLSTGLATFILCKDSMSTLRAARPLFSSSSKALRTTRDPLRLALRTTPQYIQARQFSHSTTLLADEPANSNTKKNKGLLGSLLHGSDRAKEDGLTAQSHSASVGRGKYIHEIQRHVVRPEKVEEYLALLGETYPKLAADEAFACRLVGSWQVHIGDTETFCEYPSCEVS